MPTVLAWYLQSRARSGTIVCTMYFENAFTVSVGVWGAHTALSGLED